MVHTVVHTVHTVVFYFEMYGAKLVKGTLQREEMYYADGARKRLTGGRTASTACGNNIFIRTGLNILSVFLLEQIFFM